MFFHLLKTITVLLNLAATHLLSVFHTSAVLAPFFCTQMPVYLPPHFCFCALVADISSAHLQCIIKSSSFVNALQTGDVYISIRGSDVFSSTPPLLMVLNYFSSGIKNSKVLIKLDIRYGYNQRCLVRFCILIYSIYVSQFYSKIK